MSGPVNKQKFLVTAIEANGFVRGQATQEYAEAERLFDHFRDNGAQYVEVRKIGRLMLLFGEEKGTA